MKKVQYVVIFLVVVVIGFGVFWLLSRNGNKESVLKNDEDIKNMIETFYKDSKIELPSLDTRIVDVNLEDQVKSYTGLKSKEGILGLVVSEPFITSQAYSLVVVRTDGKVNIEKMKQEMADNIDMRKWVCVSAEKLYITNSGNVIFMIMSSEEWALPVYKEFKKFVSEDIGKEIVKSEDTDIELPPEMGVE